MDIKTIFHRLKWGLLPPAILLTAACSGPKTLDDPTALRFEQRSAAIVKGGELLEAELPRIARGDCSQGERWSTIIAGYQSCQALRRDYRTDTKAAYMKGAREAVAAFKSDNSFRLWLGGWGIKLIVALIALGVIMILIRFRRIIFGLLAGVPRV